VYGKQKGGRMTKIIIRDDATHVELQTELTPKQPIQPGQKIRVFEKPDGTFVLKVGKDALDLVGMLDGNGIHLTIEEINAVIANQDHRI
jgi:hypothetical protein